MVLTESEKQKYINNYYFGLDRTKPIYAVRLKRMNSIITNTSNNERLSKNNEKSIVFDKLHRLYLAEPDREDSKIYVEPIVFHVNREHRFHGLKDNDIPTVNCNMDGSSDKNYDENVIDYTESISVERDKSVDGSEMQNLKVFQNTGISALYTIIEDTEEFDSGDLYSIHITYKWNGVTTSTQKAAMYGQDGVINMMHSVLLGKKPMMKDEYNFNFTFDIDMQQKYAIVSGIDNVFDTTKRFDSYTNFISKDTSIARSYITIVFNNSIAAPLVIATEEDKDLDLEHLEDIGDVILNSYYLPQQSSTTEVKQVYYGNHFLPNSLSMEDTVRTGVQVDDDDFKPDLSSLKQ